MNFTDWLEAERGRSEALAAHFRVTSSAVSQWKTNGVPVNNMRAVREFTAGEVSLDEMLAERPLRGPAEHAGT